MRGIAAKNSCLNVEYTVKSENIVYLHVYSRSQMYKRKYW